MNYKGESPVLGNLINPLSKRRVWGYLLLWVTPELSEAGAGWGLALWCSPSCKPVSQLQSPFHQGAGRPVRVSSEDQEAPWFMLWLTSLTWWHLACSRKPALLPWFLSIFFGPGPLNILLSLLELLPLPLSSSALQFILVLWSPVQCSLTSPLLLPNRIQLCNFNSSLWH
jgi:hypothetical protein